MLILHLLHLSIATAVEMECIINLVVKGKEMFKELHKEMICIWVPWLDFSPNEPLINNKIAYFFYHVYLMNYFSVCVATAWLFSPGLLVVREEKYGKK
jgi:hypothetical protein